MSWEFLGLFDMEIKTDTGLATGHRKKRRSKRVLILGLGNILLKDEGIGAYIATELQKKNLPENVEVIDGGTSGLDILLSQDGLYKLVIVDALKAGKKPGTIYKAVFKGRKKKNLTKIFSRKKNSQISLHQVGLIEALAAAEKLNRAPSEVIIIGVEPAEVDCGLEPTQLVKQRSAEIINTVLEEIEDAVYED